MRNPETRRKLIISGVFYPGGGLGQVMEQLALYLSREMEVVCIGFIPPGVKMPQDPFPRIRFLPIRCPPQGFRVDSREFLVALIEDEGFDTVLLLGPVHLNRPFVRQLATFGVRTIAYTASEGEMKHDHDLEDLLGFDRCLFYTEDNYKTFLDKLSAAGYGPEAAAKAGFVGHGTDTRDFFPLHRDRMTARRIARKQIYGERKLPEDAFVVLNVNRPYRRKRLDLTLEAFRLFAAGKENVFLHMHLGLTTLFEVRELERLIGETGLEQQVFLTWFGTESPLPGKDWLNRLYNASDVGMTTAMGEGWGLGLFEHAATGAPVVAPCHTSFIENWKDAGLLTKIASREFLFYENAEMHVPDPESTAQALDSLYSDPRLYDRTAVACYRRATSPENTWETTGAAFKALLHEELPEQRVLTD